MNQADASALPPAGDPLEVPMVEDGGGDAQEWLRWQHHCTAADVMVMARDPSVQRVVCEVHEDYVVQRDSGSELVNCKHREPHRGTWKLKDLCASAIGHLFDRWFATGKPLCRLMTNGSLETGAAEAAAVFAACGEQKCGAPADFDLLADRLVQALLAASRKPEGRESKFVAIPNTAKPARGHDADVPVGFRELVVEFMPFLSVRSSLPSRDHIESVNVVKVATVVLEQSGHPAPGAAAEQVYAKVVGMVADRNFRKELRGDYANWLTDSKSGSKRGSQRALVIARTILADDVRALLTSGETQRRMHLQRHEVGPQDRLRAKLRAGGGDATVINLACRLREAWQAARSTVGYGLPGDAKLHDHLEAHVLMLAADASVHAKKAGGHEWTDGMWTHVKSALEGGVIPNDEAYGLSPAHLLGLMFELSAQCQVWFSPEFDVDAVIEEVREATA